MKVTDQIKLLFLFGAIILLPIQYSNAQILSLSKINSEDGLSNNLINSIIQDKQGFIWIGTYEGLNRFDGYNIKVYKHNTSDTTTLLDDYILFLFEDDQSDIWVGSINGLSKYDRRNDCFIQYKVNNVLNENIITGTIGAADQDSSGYIWYGNQNGGVYRFSKETTRFKFYNSPRKSVSEIFIDSSNNIFVGTKDCEIYYYDNKSDRFEKSDLNLLDDSYFKDNYIRHMYQNSAGRIIMNTSHGVFNINPFSGQADELYMLPSSMSAFRNNEIRYVFEENDEITWIGTWGNGLYRYFSKSGKVENYRVDPWSVSSLSNNDVNVIYKDRGNVIWVGTQEGVTIVDPAKDVFKKFQNNPQHHNSLHFNFITSFCEDANGVIWIGTYGAGISKYNKKSNNFLELNSTTNKGALRNDAIRALCKDYLGRIWIGTMKGMDVFDPRTNRFLHYGNDLKGSNWISSNDILCIINGDDDDLWIGTFGGGLIHVRFSETGAPQFMTLKSVPGNSESLSSNYIRSLLLDYDGNIWIGTLGAGIDKLDKSSMQFIHFSTQEGLINNRINCLHQSSDSAIWIGSWGGLSRYDLQEHEFRTFTIDNGMPDNNIAEIQEDNEGNIWVSTFKGIVRITDNDSLLPAFNYYTSDNGLQGNKFNINASLKDKDGLLFFGGTTGFNVIDPNQLKGNNYKPHVVFTNLMVFNEPVEINKRINGEVILDKSITVEDEIILSYKHRIISIEFTALSFSERHKNSFKYILEGFDKQWVEVDSKRRFASYSNLPNGSYMFRVKAANSDGIWNEEEASLLIKVLPPPWKTWWAFILYGCITFAGLFFIRRYTISQADLRHKLEIEELEHKKAEEINQLKIQFFTNISHEVRTPLTLILGPLENVLEENGISEKVKNQLVLMRKNTKRLLNLVNQLMDFRKIEKGKLVLQFSLCDIVEYVKDIRENFTELAKEKKIEFNFNAFFKEKNIWIDSEKLETAIYNTLSNAFKFTNSNGKISIILDSTERSRGNAVLKRFMSLDISKEFSLSDEKEYVLITISDTGVGIPKDKLSIIFERFYQARNSNKLNTSLNQTGTGIGLSLTKDLIQLHQGAVFAESQFGRGSKFHIFIPTNENHVPESQKTSSIQKQVVIHDDYRLDTKYTEKEYLLKEEKLTVESQEKMSRLLVVEDNLDIRKFIIDSLNQHYEIFEAENGLEGYKMVIEKLPDLVISDIMMPVMDGYELCRKIKEDVRVSHIPIILLTAYNTLQNNLKGFDEGADDYIPKPFNSKLLISRIENLIDSRNRLRELFSKDVSIHPQKITTTPIDAKFIEKAVRIVEERMDDQEFNVVTFGSELCMSRTNLFRKLKSLTDQSASEFIRTVKMKNAAKLLLEGNNVAQVMDRVGISSRAYFNKCFFELYKMTPSDYLKEYLY